MNFIFLSSVLDFTIDCFQNIFSTNCLLWDFLLSDDENNDDELNNDDFKLLDNHDLLFNLWLKFDFVNLNLKFVATLFLLCNQFCNQFKSNKKWNNNNNNNNKFIHSYDID